MFNPQPRIEWKDGKEFAFTFCDDTDFSTLENVRPVYDFLAQLGIRSTKLVWLANGDTNGRNSGDTCENAAYNAWLVELQKKGFEIGLHNVACSSSKRDQIEAGFDKFRSLFGTFPRLHCNHTGCMDNLYWGDHRLSGWRRNLYRLWTRNKNEAISFGHIENDPHFWGDLCQRHIQYVRNFTFDDLNALKSCPAMPYHDKRKPFVNFWFAATNASSPKYFRQNFSEKLIDGLVSDGGLCIAYVHFGTGFFRNGKFDDHFQRIVNYVAKKNGWFAPVSEILDFLRNGHEPEQRSISDSHLRQLELKWMFDKLGKKAGI
jgi:hypothetical protein